MAVLGGRREWNLKILAMYYWSGKTINCLLHYQESFTLIKCYAWITGLGSTNSKGNIFFPKAKQNESPQKNFCWSSKTYIYDVTVAWSVSTVSGLCFEGIAVRPEMLFPGGDAKWPTAQSPVKWSHCMNKTVNNDFRFKKKKILSCGFPN